MLFRSVDEEVLEDIVEPAHAPEELGRGLAGGAPGEGDSGAAVAQLAHADDVAEELARAIEATWRRIFRGGGENAKPEIAANNRR